MRKLFFGIFCIVTFVTVMPFKGYSSNLADEEIKLYLGQSKVISVSSPKRVAVGNPEIVDVANISKSELTINPKAVGNTTLIVWDNFGEQSYFLKVFIEDTSLIKQRVDGLLAALNFPEVYTKAEDAEGRVLLLGSVKQAKDKDKIALVLAQIKDKIVDLITVKEEEAVIEIDVQILELYHGSRDTLGFTFPASVELTEVGSHAITAPGVSSFAKIFQIANVTRAAFTLKLDALIQQGKARVLSRPRLSCQSGKEAKLVVGGTVPILGGTSTAGTTVGTVGATTGGTVTYKDYGIVLNIRPQLTNIGRIHLNVDMEVSELGDAVTTSFASAYKFTKRSATTELFLDNNQTMAIGGLIKQKSTEQLRRVPWLSDIPVLGMFFRQRTSTQGSDSASSIADDTELFIILTPSLVSQEKPKSELNASQQVKASSINEDDIKDPVLKYSKIVQKLILNDFSYPAEAREAGFQGTVKLSLKLSHQGDLLDSKIKDPSGYKVLDDDALNTAQKASPYPPFPSTIKETELWVDIPIIYQLN